jgi:hypothetical protein
MMKLWAPLVWGSVALLVVAMEIGIAIGFAKDIATRSVDDWYGNSGLPPPPPPFTPPSSVPQIDRSG